MNSQVTDHGSVTTMPDADVDKDAEADAINKAVLEKYDRESITRHITMTSEVSHRWNLYTLFPFSLIYYF